MRTVRLGLLASLANNKHHILHNAVSYLNKGLSSSYLGKENNSTYYTLHKGYFAKEESDFCSDTQKC